MPALRPLLVVVAGRPGTGKTTLARALSVATDAAYLRIDVIAGPILRSGGTDDPAAAVAAYAIARELAAENLDLGRAVVVDGLHATHERREAWAGLATSAGSRLEYVETFVSDEDEHRRRVELRSSGEAGYLGPSWDEGQAMPYEPWDEARPGPRLVVEMSDVDAALAAVVTHLDRTR